MRELPSARLERATDYVADHRHSYDVVSNQDGYVFGHVIRNFGPGDPAPRMSWRGYVLATAGEYGSGLRPAKGGPFRTRQEALIAVLTTWQVQEAELKAHAIEEAVQAGIRLAERHAAEQMAKGPHQRLIPTQYSDRAFSVSTRTATRELETERNDLRNRLKGLKPAGSHYVQRNAYMVRMYEVELKRRAREDVENHCHAFARQGVGEGMCDVVLDSQGACPNADNHIEEALA
jgi:hypothetical protein